MATTSWPTWSVAETPMSTVGRPVASTLITARSTSGLVFTTRAAISWPSLNWTVRFDAPSTTWLLVRIQPLVSKMNPEPTPVSGMENGFSAPRSLVTVTTAGLTWSATVTMTDGTPAPAAGLALGFGTAVGPAWTSSGVGIATGRGPDAPDPGWRSATVPSEAMAAAASETTSRVTIPAPPRTGGGSGSDRRVGGKGPVSHELGGVMT